MYLHIQRAQTSPLPIKNPTIHHHRQVLIPIYSALARTLTGPCDLVRKEKALSEAAALLILQKKFRALWEDEAK